MVIFHGHVKLPEGINLPWLNERPLIPSKKTYLQHRIQDREQNESGGLTMALIPVVQTHRDVSSKIPNRGLRTPIIGNPKVILVNSIRDRFTIFGQQPISRLAFENPSTAESINNMSPCDTQYPAGRRPCGNPTIFLLDSIREHPQHWFRVETFLRLRDDFWS